MQCSSARLQGPPAAFHTVALWRIHIVAPSTNVDDHAVESGEIERAPASDLQVSRHAGRRAVPAQR